MFLEVDSDITADAFQACVVSQTDGSASAELAVVVEDFEDRPEKIYPVYWRATILICSDPPSWVASGTARLTVKLSLPMQGMASLAQHVNVEPIPQEPAGDIGACVAPYITARPTLHDWIMHLRNHQVAAFYLYVPEGPGVDLVVAKSRVPESRAASPPEPFFSTLIWWRHYYPSAWSHYFGQVMSYNHCLFMNRRRHKYMLMLDVDEFLAIGNGTLLDVLDQYLNSATACLLLPIQWQGVTCARQDDMSIYEGYDSLCASSALPDLSAFEPANRTQWWHNAKGAVRPLNVVQQHVHQPLKVAPQVQRKAWLSQIEPEIAVIRHVRCTGPAISY